MKYAPKEIWLLDNSELNEDDDNRCIWSPDADCEEIHEGYKSIGHYKYIDDENSLSMDDLIATLPDDGSWRLERTKVKDPDGRYLASWSHMDAKGILYNKMQYGPTPWHAMAQLVISISGPLTKGGNESDD